MAYLRRLFICYTLIVSNCPGTNDCENADAPPPFVSQDIYSALDVVRPEATWALREISPPPEGFIGGHPREDNEMASAIELPPSPLGSMQESINSTREAGVNPEGQRTQLLDQH